MKLTPPVVVDRDRGLPSSQVHRIVQDRLDRLWMAGPSGLGCYDGTRVRSLDRRHGLRCAGLRTVALGADDTVWIGTDLGVEAIDARGLPLPLMQGQAWPYGLVGGIVARARDVWLGTSQGLVQIVDPAGSARVGTHHDLGYVHDAVRIDDQRLAVVSASRGLHLVGDDGCRTLDLPPALRSSDLRRVAATDDGGLVVGAAHAVWLFDRDGRALGECIQLAGDIEVAAVAARGREVWVGAGATLLGWAPGGPDGWHEVHRSTVGGKINDLLVDSWGSIWIATDTAGVARLNGLHRALQRIDVGAAVYTIRDGPAGTLQLGGDRFAAELKIADPGTAPDRCTTLPSTVWDVAVDPADGASWLATHAGLFRAPPGGPPARWTRDAGLLSAPCRALLAHDGALWVGTLGGLVRLQDGVAEAVPGNDGLSLGYVYNLQLDHDGRLWVGTLGRGLWREGAAGLEPVNGGPLEPASNTYVVAMAPVPGRILVIQDERIVLLDAGQPPRLVAVEFPVGGWTGLWLDAHRVAVGSSDGLRIIDSRNGVVERHINALYDSDVWEFTNNRALHRGPDGRLYCGVNGGLVAVSLDALAPFCVPPRAALSQVVWQGAAPETDGTWTCVDPGKWSLEVQVFAAWLLDEQRVTFRYQLVGFDPTWSEPTRQAAIRYSSLPPGEYLLQVQAQSPLTGPGEAVTMLRLRVRKPVMNALWVRAADAYDRVFGLALRNRRLLQRHGELEAEVKARRAAEAQLETHRAGLETLVNERTRELLAARDEALRANRAKSDFLSRMSHELRTPMNALLGFAQLMEIDGSLSARNQQFVKEMLIAGRHLLVLINEVLDLAQIESGTVVLSLEPLRLPDMVNGSVQMIGPAAMQAGITVEVMDLRPWKVVADRTRLRQVLINLLSNAVKYNRAGGFVRIEAAAADEGRVRISVIDGGPGIAPQRLDELFQPFNRLGAEFSRVEGSGIGLAIVRHLATMMNGRVGVDSRLGEGSRFWVELPSAAQVPTPQALTAAAAAPHQPGLARRASVLYVEDNAANRLVVAHVVGRHGGVRLLLAADAAEGLALARSERPDLVLLDLQLPDQDGYAVLQQLKADPVTAPIPVVAVTAYAMQADLARTTQAGFVDHLPKPIDIASFDRMLEHWLPPSP